MPAFKANFRAPYADTQHFRTGKLSPVNSKEIMPLLWRGCANNMNPQDCFPKDLVLLSKHIEPPEIILQYVGQDTLQVSLMTLDFLPSLCLMPFKLSQSSSLTIHYTFQTDIFFLYKVENNISQFYIQHSFLFNSYLY